ncbi:hypothetical protein ABIB62_004429 [Mucilaginibacter sp. UYP25]|uniref:IS982 family transposase n=1 Tax=unclassified Mucilaginibacter TaxID=2617802 RepID=UPI003399408A
MILKFSILREYLTLSYMHNLKTNFDKFLFITKSVLADHLRPDGNFGPYRHPPKFSDIEIVSLSLTAEALGIDSENLLFYKLKKEYMAEFPALTHRCNYNRRRKRLNGYISLVSDKIAKKINPQEQQYIIDSIPLPVCQNARTYRTTICRDDPKVLPAKGYHASHKLHYFGFKMQLIITRQGIPISAGLTAANVHDVHYLGMLGDVQLHGCELIADKGYLSLPYQTSLFETDKIRLITPLRVNMKNRVNQWTPGYRHMRKR